MTLLAICSTSDQTMTGGDYNSAAYGTNYERLATLKSHYDPMNLFRFNQNIKPAK